LERSLRDSLPRAGEWPRRGRRLTLALLVALPPARSAAPSTAGGAGIAAMGVLLMTGKKLALLAVVLVLSAAFGLFWMADPLGIFRDPPRETPGGSGE